MPADHAGKQALLELIDDAAKTALEHGSGQRADTHHLLREYYRFVAPDDLLGRDPADVSGAALSHVELAQRRTPGTALVRVLSPRAEVDG
jgi:glutamate dehydrogenase